MRGISLLFLFIIGYAISFADQIITRNADIIECIVLNIGDRIITYKKGGESFQREIPREDVFKIKYDNGSEDIITTAPAQGGSSNASSTQTVSDGQLVSTEPDWSQFPKPSKKYQIGDWYSENGVEGIVIWTTEDGLHGRILHPKKFNNAKFRKPIAFFIGPTNLSIGMNDRDNGYSNWLKLLEFMQSNPQFGLEMYPIPSHIMSLGEGWYLPSIGELKYLKELRGRIIHYQGENAKFDGKTVKWYKILNEVSKAHGGSKHDDYYQLSSTEMYSNGGANATLGTLFGDPQEAQYSLLKLEDCEDLPVKPIVRNKGFIPYYAFHLF